ncbi:MAG: carbohydrate ABC transporter permease [Faecalibacterium sp.]
MFNNRSSWIKSLKYHIPVMILAIIMLYPLIWMVASSLKENTKILTDAANLIPETLQWQNYVTGWAGFGGNTFAVFFKNSFVIAVLATIGAVSSSAVVAYGFARIDFKFKGFWFMVLMATMMLPEQVLLIPQYLMFKQFGWINTILPLVVPYFCAVPFFVFLNMQFLRGLPFELDEAATIDGCGKLQVYFHILLPLTSPALITSCIFSFCWRWQEFLNPMIYLSSPENYTFAIAIKMFSDPAVQSDWGALFAMSTLSLIPVALIFIFFQKYLVEGVATTGIKG